MKVIILSITFLGKVFGISISYESKAKSETTKKESL